MIISHDEYFEYLKRRSRAALFYRRWYLYPRLCRHLSGITLDIGCGVGDLLAFRPRTVGTDINPKAVAYCRGLGLNAVMMQQDELPFSNEQFDSAILDNVLEHLTHPVPLLREIARVLKPGGVLLVGVPGERGYAWDSDHKVYYDETALITTVESVPFRRKRVFHVPWPSVRLSRKLRQYCLYGVFQRS